MVDTSEMDDEGRYYGGFTFVSYIYYKFYQTGRKTGAPDATHCKGKLLHKYRTTLRSSFTTQTSILDLSCLIILWGLSVMNIGQRYSNSKSAVK